jgi:sirohydrochlorin ferrochelatase
MTGYIVFAHGSSIESANEAVRVVAQSAAERDGWKMFEAAFLEGGRPNLSEAVNKLIDRGASTLIVLPYFLTLGLHLQRDLPYLIESLRCKHPEVEIQVTAPLDGHHAMVDALLDRAHQAEGSAKSAPGPDESIPSRHSR